MLPMKTVWLIMPLFLFSGQSVSEEDDWTSGGLSTSMNPLAKPFVYKQSPSCEQRIMADQLRVNKSFGLDEPIAESYCPSFFPPLAMSTPNYSKVCITFLLKLGASRKLGLFLV